MTQSAIFWIVIAALLLVIFIVDAIAAHAGRTAVRQPRRHRAHFISMGNERDMFYGPGDFNHDKMPEELD